ncbi:MAG: lactate racemase domain-containing protein [Candidatus Odinarchaeota archaeon]
MDSQVYLDTPIFYESDRISFFIPKEANCQYLKVPDVQFLKKEEITGRLLAALNSPLNTPSLQQLLENHYVPGKPVIILVDDHTRPNIHTRALLPPLATELSRCGVKEGDIGLVIATGTHAPPAPEQIRERVLGELYDDWKDRLWVHDCDDLENHEQLGFSPSKTPILIDKRVLSSSLIIPLSDSEYHYFAGIAGSIKLFMPGVSARQTVRVNHSRIFDLETGFKTDCCMGNIDGNACIQDIRDIVRILQENHVVFVIDAIMHKGKFINIFAGEPIAIQENAISALASFRNINIREKADLVIVGKPSVNLYQGGKGFNAASHAVKPGGHVVLLAGCPDGIGPVDYLETMEAVKNHSHKEAMQWIITNKCSETTFEIGIQNAVDLYRILQLTGEGHVHLYSELDQKLLKETFHIESLDTTKPPAEALRFFVREFLFAHPNAVIHVFEDFNILAIPE